MYHLNVYFEALALAVQTVQYVKLEVQYFSIRIKPIFMFLLLEIWKDQESENWYQISVFNYVQHFLKLSFPMRKLSMHSIYDSMFSFPFCFLLYERKGPNVLLDQDL